MFWKCNTINTLICALSPSLSWLVVLASRTLIIPGVDQSPNLINHDVTSTHTYNTCMQTHSHWSNKSTTEDILSDKAKGGCLVFPLSLWDTHTPLWSSKSDRRPHNELSLHLQRPANIPTLMVNPNMTLNINSNVILIPVLQNHPSCAQTKKKLF